VSKNLISMFCLIVGGTLGAFFTFIVAMYISFSDIKVKKKVYLLPAFFLLLLLISPIIKKIEDKLINNYEKIKIEKIKQGSEYFGYKY